MDETAPPDLAFRTATPADVPTLVALIESAYRGEASRAGWTTEADLLGGQRTDPAGVRAVIDSPAARLIIAEHGGSVVACCQLADRGYGGCVGVFAVTPTRQGGGIGKRVLEHAERTAVTALAVTRMELTVISAREDLIAWYYLFGYRRTGEFSPF